MEPLSRLNFRNFALERDDRRFDVRDVAGVVASTGCSAKFGVASNDC